MKRGVRVALVVATVLVLAGCQRQRMPQQAAQPGTGNSTASVETTALLQPGARVALQNGLGLVVPVGWTGVRRSYSGPRRIHLADYNDVYVLEKVELQQIRGPYVPPAVTQDVTFYSLASPKSIQTTDQTLVVSSSDLRVFSDRDTPQFGGCIIETSLGNWPQGLMIFGGKFDDPRGFAQEVWRLLKISGASLPESRQ